MYKILSLTVTNLKEKIEISISINDYYADIYGKGWYDINGYSLTSIERTTDPDDVTWKSPSVIGKSYLFSVIATQNTSLKAWFKDVEGNIASANFEFSGLDFSPPRLNISDFKDNYYYDSNDDIIFYVESNSIPANICLLKSENFISSLRDKYGTYEKFSEYLKNEVLCSGNSNFVSPSNLYNYNKNSPLYYYIYAKDLNGVISDVYRLSILDSYDNGIETTYKCSLSKLIL